MSASAPVKIPPGPRRWPVIGQLLAFRRDPLQFLQSLPPAYGGITFLRLGNQDVYFLNDAKLIEQVLVTENQNFTKSRVLQRARTFLGDGLLTAEGQPHLRQRRLVQPAFHRDRLIRYAEDMAQIGDRFRNRWQNNAVMDMDQEMMRLTLAIVGKTLFSADVESESKEVGESMEIILGLFQLVMLPFSTVLEKLPLPVMKRFHKAKATLDDIIYGLIAQRRADGKDHGDLLSMLLNARDEEGDGAGLTDTQVRDEAITLFLAGHETTANALTWTWYLLSQHPEVEARMHGEIDQVLEGRLPSFHDFPKLPYVEHVMAEAMRLYPPAWAIGRQARNDFTLGGYSIPAKSIILMSPYVTHRSADYWPNPTQFDPDRWSQQSGDRPKFAYFPFGGGPRLCIGERFAWMEGVLLISAIAQKWKFKLASGQVVDTKPLITLRPRHGMKMHAVSRL